MLAFYDTTLIILRQRGREREREEREKKKREKKKREKREEKESEREGEKEREREKRKRKRFQHTSGMRASHSSAVVCSAFIHAGRPSLPCSFLSESLQREEGTDTAQSVKDGAHTACIMHMVKAGMYVCMYVSAQASC